MDKEYVVGRLKKYVNMPSGSSDLDGLDSFETQVVRDMQALGFKVARHSGKLDGAGDSLECVMGTGKNTLLLLGHMDTVFAREDSVPLSVKGDIARGSGVMDMKGGLLIMQEALRGIQLPPDTRIVALLNGDEETGSATSCQRIRDYAKKSFAALSFEPKRDSGALVGRRKGNISFTVRCTGITGHAGSAYLSCASAIQQICAVVTDLYTLRDDAREISVNVGVIKGGRQRNAVADEASIKAEVRCYSQEHLNEMLGKIEAICAKPGIPGTTTKLEIRSSHCPVESDERNAKLIALARQIGEEQGINVFTEDTGGSGDISYAAEGHIACLDGLGLLGGGMHTTDEFGVISSFEPSAVFAGELIRRLLANPDAVK